MDFSDKTQEFDASKLGGAGALRATRRTACFIVVAGGQVGRLHKVGGEVTVIGRAAEAGIRIEDEGVSRRHCQVSPGAEGAIVAEDLGSTNGTFVNGERISRRVLQDGDKLQVGRTTILKFSYQDAVDEDFQRRQYEWATRDALTGCFNRKYFVDRLPSEFAFALRYKKPLAVAMLDLDHFKAVNDTYGHAAGDYVLRQTAQVLLQLTRRSDVVARLGGEEFGLVMREASPDDALLVADRIRHTVETTTFTFDGRTIPVTVSIGLAVFGSRIDDPDTGDALLQLADRLLYRAKHAGRNRVETGSA